jgi:hypothetical protein
MPQTLESVFLTFRTATVKERHSKLALFNILFSLSFAQTYLSRVSASC